MRTQTTDSTSKNGPCEKWKRLYRRCSKYQKRILPRLGKFNIPRHYKRLRKKLIPHARALELTLAELKLKGVKLSDTFADPKSAELALCRWNRWYQSVDSLLDYEDCCRTGKTYPVMPKAMRDEPPGKQAEWYYQQEFKPDEGDKLSAKRQAEVVEESCERRAKLVTSALFRARE